MWSTVSLLDAGFGSGELRDKLELGGKNPATLPHQHAVRAPK